MTAASAPADFVDLDGHWSLRAACRDVPTNLFFPTKEPGRQTTDDAKRVCITCQFRQPCLDENYQESDGIYGGFTEDERRALRRRGWRPGDKLPPVTIRPRARVKARPAYRDPDDTSYVEPDQAWVRDAHRYAIEHGLSLAQIARHVGVYPLYLNKKFASFQLTGLKDGRKYPTPRAVKSA